MIIELIGPGPEEKTVVADYGDFGTIVKVKSLSNESTSPKQREGNEQLEECETED